MSMIVYSITDRSTLLHMCKLNVKNMDNRLDASFETKGLVAIASLRKILYLLYVISQLPPCNTMLSIMNYVSTQLFILW